MTLRNLQNAMDEAARFIGKAVKAKHDIKKNNPDISDDCYIWLTEETDSVKKSSMDLSRALSAVRK